MTSIYLIDWQVDLYDGTHNGFTTEQHLTLNEKQVFNITHSPQSAYESKSVLLQGNVERSQTTRLSVKHVNLHGHTKFNAFIQTTSKFAIHYRKVVLKITSYCSYSFNVLCSVCKTRPELSLSTLHWIRCSCVNRAPFVSPKCSRTNTA